MALDDMVKVHWPPPSVVQKPKRGLTGGGGPFCWLSGDPKRCGRPVSPGKESNTIAVSGGAGGGGRVRGRGLLWSDKDAVLDECNEARRQAGFALRDESLYGTIECREYLRHHLNEWECQFE
jgi:hypothetical protein